MMKSLAKEVHELLQGCGSVNSKIMLWRNHSQGIILWNCEVDPHSPPEGEATCGGKPPTPRFQSSIFRCPLTPGSTGRGSMRPRAAVVLSQINLWSLAGFLN